MPGYVIRGLRKGKFGWAALVLLAVFAGILLPGLLPRVLEGWLVRALEEKGWEVQSLPVEQIGITHSRLSESFLSRDSLTAEWASVTVDYRPGHLLEGRLERVSIEEPVVVYQVKRLVTEVSLSDLPPPMIYPDGSFPFAEDSPVGSRQVPRKTGKEEVLWEDGFPSDEPVMEEVRAGIHELFRDIPFKELQATGGVLKVFLPDGRGYSGNWNARVDQGHDSVESQFFLESDFLSLALMIQGTDAGRTLMLQSDMELFFGEILEEVRDLFAGDKRVSEIPEIQFQEPLKLEILGELNEGSSLILSGQASLERFSVALPDISQPLRIGSVLAIFTRQEERTTVHGGIHFEALSAGNVQLDPLVLKVDFESGDRLRMESESFSARLGEWTAVGALRGSVGFAGRAFEDGQVEYAVSSFQGDTLGIEPASMLVKADPSRLQFQFSPLGLTRATTVWVEEMQVEWSLSEGTGTSGFTWFNQAGARMGGVSIEAEHRGPDSWAARFSGSDGEGRAILSGVFEQIGDQTSLAFNGKPPTGWINALARWWGGLPPFTLSGEPPGFAAQLVGEGLFLKGWASLQVSGLSLSLPEGKTLTGIESDVRLRVMGFPRTDGTQVTRIQSLESGDIRLEDILLEWALPTYRTLRVERMVARMGGGRVEVPPFTMDLMEPDLSVDLVFTDLDSGAFLEWLGEDRFVLEGQVSGRLTVAWKDGIIHVGKGTLTKSESSFANRFLFSDPDFLRNQFASIEGVPEEVRGRLLEALLEEGIRLDDFRLELLPLPESREVSLRLTVSGETRSERIIVPIEGFVINNIISEEDLAHLLGMVGSIRFLANP